MLVMCPPSLTELCRYLFIKESVRFPAGSGRLLFTAAEQQPENGTAQRAAVQHLPAQGHGHVAALGVHPACDRPGRQQLQQRFSTRGVQGWAERAETLVRGPFLLYLPVVFKISTKVCLFLCVVCEWTNDAPACIIKPETREVQQKLK